MNIVLITILSLAFLGVLAGLILYFVAQKFKVFEDPRIDQVEAELPAANCGGCGFPGCRAFAEAMVKADDISELNCPVGGAETMKAAAAILGKTPSAAPNTVAVLKCNGTCENRPRITKYDGATSCTIASSLFGGETGCSYGCVGLGECVDACKFGAMYMDKETGLPVIIEDKCISCGACVKACPKNIIELRKQGPKNRRIYVACANKDKGAPAKKACATACIACCKCMNECSFGAIIVDKNLAAIDPVKCKMCRKCAPVCPTNAILEMNFPPKKIKVEETLTQETKEGDQK